MNNVADASEEMKENQDMQNIGMDDLQSLIPTTKAKYGGQLPKAQWWNPSKAYNTVKNVVKLNKYNKSKDAFGNTGRMLTDDITIPVSKAKSIVEYKGLKNTIPTSEELSRIMAEYTVDSTPFKFGSGLGKEGASWPLSVIRGPNGEIINAQGDEYALKLQDYIKNNKLEWSSLGRDKNLSLVRQWNENESISGTHGNIAALKQSFKLGEPIQLGDITSWSAGEAGLNNFGNNRYVIKDFDFETPALLNEYNKFNNHLSKNQANVWKEREVILDADRKFKITNIIKDAPRQSGWDLFTNLKETNPKLWDETFLSQQGFNINKAGGYSFTQNPTKKLWPTGQINPNYEKIQTLIKNDPSLHVKPTPNYGTDVELELIKKYGGSLPKAQWWNLANAYGKAKNALTVTKNKGLYNSPINKSKYSLLNQSSATNILDQNNKFLGLNWKGKWDLGEDLTTQITNKNFRTFKDNNNSLIDFNAPRGNNFGTSIWEDHADFSPLLLDDVTNIGLQNFMDSPYLGVDNPLNIKNFTDGPRGTQSNKIIETRNNLVARIKTTEGRKRIRENYLGSGATEADVNKFIASVEQSPILHGTNDWYMRGLSAGNITEGKIPYVRMDPNLPVNYVSNIQRHEDEHLLDYVAGLILNPAKFGNPLNLPKWENVGPKTQ